MILGLTGTKYPTEKHESTSILLAKFLIITLCLWTHFLIFYSGPRFSDTLTFVVSYGEELQDTPENFTEIYFSHEAISQNH